MERPNGGEFGTRKQGGVQSRRLCIVLFIVRIRTPNHRMLFGLPPVI